MHVIHYVSCQGHSKCSTNLINDEEEDEGDVEEDDDSMM